MDRLVGVTDGDWYRLLASQPGELFLFKPQSPNIVQGKTHAHDEQERRESPALRSPGLACHRRRRANLPSFTAIDDRDQGPKRIIHCSRIGKQLRHVRLEKHDIRALRVSRGVFPPHTSAEVIFGSHVRFPHGRFDLLHTPSSLADRRVEH